MAASSASLNSNSQGVGNLQQSSSNQVTQENQSNVRRPGYGPTNQQLTPVQQNSSRIFLPNPPVLGYLNPNEATPVQQNSSRVFLPNPPVLGYLNPNDLLPPYTR
jgi:hypothetical protein